MSSLSTKYDKTAININYSWVTACPMLIDSSGTVLTLVFVV